uniref:Uncharacterized protein n=1 Tax=Arundo donax TaxID=35708 RepID=A0A0A9AH91_ARUDO
MLTWLASVLPCQTSTLFYSQLNNMLDAIVMNLCTPIRR